MKTPGWRPDRAALRRSLDLGSPDCGVEGVALGLHVHPTQAEGVLVDDPVDAAVVGQLGTGRGAVRSPVAHGHEEVEHALLEEGGIVGVQPGEQLDGDVGVDAGDAFLDLFGRVDLGGGRHDLYSRRTVGGLGRPPRVAGPRMLPQLDLGDARRVVGQQSSSHLVMR